MITLEDAEQTAQKAEAYTKDQTLEPKTRTYWLAVLVACRKLIEALKADRT